MFTFIGKKVIGDGAKPDVAHRYVRFFFRFADSARFGRFAKIKVTAGR